MAQPIPTGALAGFPELLPEEQVAFDRLRDAIRGVYERFGFLPVETSAVERPAVLFAKEGGETSRQVYRISGHEDEMALRFDHTVPLARYVVEHSGELVFPFRRYAIGRVYRGERSQKGRFREFYQCDVDVIGDGALDLAHDADVLAVVSAAFDAMAVGDIVVRVSNRKILAGLVEFAGLTQRGGELFRIVDQLDKVGEQGVRASLEEGLGDGSAVDLILRAVSIKGAPAEAIGRLRALGVESSTFEAGVAELEAVTRLAVELGVPAERVVVDVSIARGLDYYTGTVYETNLTRHPELGSVCSGGRYDDLAAAYGSRSYPGVGVSIGLSRLFAQLREAGLLQLGAKTPTKVLVVPLLDDKSAPLAVAATLRDAGIPTEVYLEAKKAKSMFAYADRLGIPLVAAVGEAEAAAGTCTLKRLDTGAQEEVPLVDLVGHVRAALGWG